MKQSKKELKLELEKAGLYETENDYVCAKCLHVVFGGEFYCPSCGVKIADGIFKMDQESLFFLIDLKEISDKTRKIYHKLKRRK